MGLKDWINRKAAENAEEENNRKIFQKTSKTI